jgi:hypothetical protein
MPTMTELGHSKPSAWIPTEQAWLTDRDNFADQITFLDASSAIAELIRWLKTKRPSHPRTIGLCDMTSNGQDASDNFRAGL